MLTYEQAINLHGHNGPLLAIGYKMGQYAMEKFNPENMKDLKCEVRCPWKKPYTCIIDGIQSSTTCTPGKANLKVTTSEKGITVQFIHKNREEILMEIQPDILEYSFNCDDLNSGADYIMSLKKEEVVKIIKEK